MSTMITQIYMSFSFDYQIYCVDILRAKLTFFRTMQTEVLYICTFVLLFERNYVKNINLQLNKFGHKKR